MDGSSTIVPNATPSTTNNSRNYVTSPDEMGTSINNPTTGQLSHIGTVMLLWVSLGTADNRSTSMYERTFGIARESNSLFTFVF